MDFNKKSDLTFKCVQYKMNHKPKQRIQSKTTAPAF